MGPARRARTPGSRHQCDGGDRHARVLRLQHRPPRRRPAAAGAAGGAALRSEGQRQRGVCEHERELFDDYAYLYDYVNGQVGYLANVPAPLPLVGIGTAFAWSRRLRRRLAPRGSD